MKEQRVHLKLKGRAICGQKRNKRPLKFVTDEAAVSCERCKRAIEK